MPRQKVIPFGPWTSFQLVAGEVCGSCGGPVRMSPSGVVCQKGHGGSTRPVEASAPSVQASARRQPRVHLVPFEGARLVQLDTIEQVDALRRDELAGAIVKVAPTVLASARGDFDAGAVADKVRAAGAAAVIVVPKVVADARLPSRADAVVQQSETPRSAVAAWFAELAGLTDEDRAECIEHANRCIDQAEGA